MGRLSDPERAKEVGRIIFCSASAESQAILSLLNAYLQEALQLTDLALTHFWDNKAGGFFQTAHDGEELPARQKDFQDGAIPSGNSVALTNLARLARMTGRMELEEKGRQLVAAFAAAVAQTPTAYTHFLQAAVKRRQFAQFIQGFLGPTARCCGHADQQGPFFAASRQGSHTVSPNQQLEG